MLMITNVVSDISRDSAQRVKLLKLNGLSSLCCGPLKKRGEKK